MLRIPVDKLCVIVAMAREAMGGEPAVHETAEADRGEEGGFPSSEEYESERSYDALFDYVDSLNCDELADLLALLWVGRGDFAAEEWPEAQRQAEAEFADGDALAEIVQDPMLPDDVTAGAEALGYSCPDGE